MSGVEVLLAELESPLYFAVIDKEPAGRFILVLDAMPPTKLTVPIPKEPFQNVTVPVGTLLPTDATEAVRVTD